MIRRLLARFLNPDVGWAISYDLRRQACRDEAQIQTDHLHETLKKYR